MLRLAFHRGVRHTPLLERIKVPPPPGSALTCILLQLVVGLHVSLLALGRGVRKHCTPSCRMTLLHAHA